MHSTQVRETYKQIRNRIMPLIIECYGFSFFKQILLLYLLSNNIIFLNYFKMIQTMWEKRIVFEINMQKQDVADELSPLPLFLQMSWHHYIGVYYQQIQSFYSSWVLYPIQKDQFYLTLQSQNLELNGTQIVGHLVTLYNQGILNPVKLICKFRNNNKKPNIQIKKLFKNTLKASACVRNRKIGASILTVHMSVQNVQNMYESYINNDFINYLGSDNFQNDNKGYKFLISKSQKIPVKFIGKQFNLQRGVSKTTSLGRFMAEILGQQLFQQQQVLIEQLKQLPQISQQDSSTRKEQYLQSETPISQIEKIQNPQKNDNKYDLRYNKLFQKYNLLIHGIRLSRGQYLMSFFQKFCNPDGYLYIFYRQN